MDILKKAAWIIGSQKKLENIPNSVQGLNSFSATIWAGRCGRLLSNIRSREFVNSEQLEVFANVAGILTVDLDTYLKPLEELRYLKVKRSADGTILRVEDCLLSKEEVLNNTTSLFNTKAKPIEIANLSALDITAQRPIEEINLKQALYKQGFLEKDIDKLVDLQVNFQLLQRQEGYGLPQPFIFNEYIWGQDTKKIAYAISSMAPKERQKVEDVTKMIQASQGFPKQQLHSIDDKTLALLTKIGMLDIVTISTSKRDDKDFITTPQMWGTLKLDLLSDDILDDIKVFLNSVRYGEHYGRIGTGKIANPVVLVKALLDREKIGPCSAIGTDYIMLEKAGIVEVERASDKPGKQFYMRLLKREVAAHVRDILEHGTVLPGQEDKQLAFDFPPATSYRDPETNRVRTKITTKDSQEAFSAMIDKLRSK